MALLTRRAVIPRRHFIRKPAAGGCHHDDTSPCSLLLGGCRSDLKWGGPKCFASDGDLLFSVELALRRHLNAHAIDRPIAARGSTVVRQGDEGRHAGRRHASRLPRHYHGGDQPGVGTGEY